MDIISVVNGNIVRAKSAGLVPRKHDFHATQVTTAMELIHYAAEFDLGVHRLMTENDLMSCGIEAIRTALDEKNQAKNHTMPLVSKASDGYMKNYTATAVKNARKAQQLSQQQLGELAGVSRRTINAAESGQDGVRLTTIAAIADALNMPITQFVYDPAPRVDLAAGFAILRTIRNDPIYAEICALLNS